ncbi:MAG: class III poly(R)-hydroxyalkanoic acid synthase subunit PhaC [Pseudomonadota bacterium]|nr:class III poly(R)-hydroxyalkanoic acid synthase subunit PhaC [Pseudomonadota bacterium]
MTSPGFYSALAAASRCTPGCSARDVVWSSGTLRLYRYRRPQTASAAVPLLIVYALVNPPSMLDLQEDRSLIRGLLNAGLDVYLIDWGDPGGADRLMTMADYLALLDDCVRFIRGATNTKALNLLGVCQGGVFSLCYTALNPRHVRNLITMVTPVDFQTPRDLLSKWVRHIDVAAWVGDGNVGADTLNQLFLSLMPFKLAQQKYVDLLLRPPSQSELDTFMRIEKWIFDSPDLAGAAFREFVVGLYQQNGLMRNTLEIGGRGIDLSSLTLPVLNLFGSKDHLVPREASLALGGLIRSTDYTPMEFDLGHIGMYVSGRAQKAVPPAIAGWLKTR